MLDASLKHTPILAFGNDSDSTYPAVDKATVSPEDIAKLQAYVRESSITLTAPNKTYNTAGVGFGFAIISNPKLRGKFQKIVNEVHTQVVLITLIILISLPSLIT